MGMRSSWRLGRLLLVGVALMALGCQRSAAPAPPQALVIGDVQDASRTAQVHALMDDGLLSCVQTALDRLGGAPLSPLPTPPLWIEWRDSLPTAGMTLPPDAASGWRPRILLDRAAWNRAPASAARRSLIAHEVVHAMLMLRETPPLPLWFEEGIAVIVAQECGDRDPAFARALSQTTTLTPTAWPARPTMAQYAASASLTAWILARLPPHHRPLDRGRFPHGPTLEAVAATLDPPLRPEALLAQWGVALLLHDPDAHAWSDALRAGRPALHPLPAHVTLPAGAVRLLGPVRGPAQVRLTPLVADSSVVMWDAWTASWTDGTPPLARPLTPAPHGTAWRLPPSHVGVVVIAAWSDTPGATGTMQVALESTGAAP